MPNDDLAKAARDFQAAIVAPGPLIDAAMLAADVEGRLSDAYSDAGDLVDELESVKKKTDDRQANVAIEKLLKQAKKTTGKINQALADLESLVDALKRPLPGD